MKKTTPRRQKDKDNYLEEVRQQVLLQTLQRHLTLLCCPVLSRYIFLLTVNSVLESYSYLQGVFNCSALKMTKYLKVNIG